MASDFQRILRKVKYTSEVSKTGIKPVLFLNSEFYLNMLFFLLISLVYFNCADRGGEIISKGIIIR
jgi:hypothetical protein